MENKTTVPKTDVHEHLHALSGRPAAAAALRRRRERTWAGRSECGHEALERDVVRAKGQN